MSTANRSFHLPLIMGRTGFAGSCSPEPPCQACILYPAGSSGAPWCATVSFPEQPSCFCSQARWPSAHHQIQPVPWQASPSLCRAAGCLRGAQAVWAQDLSSWKGYHQSCQPLDNQSHCGAGKHSEASGQVEEEVPPTGPRKVPPLPSRLGQLLLVMPSVYVCLCDAIMVHYFWKKSKQGAYGAGKGTPSRKREDMIELFVPPLCFRRENSS